MRTRIWGASISFTTRATGRHGEMRSHCLMVAATNIPYATSVNTVMKTSASDLRLRNASNAPPMRPITSGRRNTRTTGRYGAASADNGCRDNHTSAAPKSPPIAIDTRPASLFHRLTPVEYPISTAVGGIAGNRYRITLSPGDNVKNARTVTTHTAQNRNTEGPPARACQPSRRPGHNQPVHGSVPNGMKMTYASNPVHAGAALGLESAGWKHRPIPRDPLRQVVSTNALPCRRPAATNHGAATMRKAETAAAVCRSQARGHFGRSRTR